MTSRACTVLALAAIFGAGAACRPTIDGAWEGDADCNGSGKHTVSALFNEQGDFDLEGKLYIENIPFFGTELTLPADIDDGEYDPDDNEYDFKLNVDSDNDPEFDVKLAIDDDDPDNIDGDIDQFDDNGNVNDTCDLSLDRLSTPGD